MRIQGTRVLISSPLQPIVLCRTAALGVAINSAPTEGVPVVPLSQLKSTFPALRTVGRKKAAGFTLEQWRYAFTNTFTEEESKATYQRYHVPASVRVLWGSALATLKPGYQDTFVNYDNDNRAPLLFISGGEDHLMPPVSSALTPSITRPTP